MPDQPPRAPLGPRVLLAAGTTALVLLTGWLALKLTVAIVGLPDPDFRYENEVAMWNEDDRRGFVNKPDFLDFVFGNVRVQTDADGFRGNGDTPRRLSSDNGLIVGLGDSVMWGTGVNEEQSLLGILGRQLGESQPYAVINAGVVGYSTYQEYVDLTTRILPLEPDVVLVNYCVNDFLPTEDPFGNVRQIYGDYVEALLGRDDMAFSAMERDRLAQLIAVFRSPDVRVWDEVSALRDTSSEWLALTTQVFVDIPVAWMADASRQAGVRLIYLLVPPSDDPASYATMAERLTQTLARHGSEWIDVQASLTEDADQEASGTSPILDMTWPKDLRALLSLWRLHRVQTGNLFLDEVHPTARGNAIIAQLAYEYLIDSAESDRGASGSR